MTDGQSISSDGGRSPAACYGRLDPPVPKKLAIRSVNPDDDEPDDSDRLPEEHPAASSENKMIRAVQRITHSNPTEPSSYRSGAPARL